MSGALMGILKLPSASRRSFVNCVALQAPICSSGSLLFLWSGTSAEGLDDFHRCENSSSLPGGFRLQTLGPWLMPCGGDGFFDAFWMSTQKIGCGIPWGCLQPWRPNSPLGCFETHWGVLFVDNFHLFPQWVQPTARVTISFHHVLKHHVTKHLKKMKLCRSYPFFVPQSFQSANWLLGWFGARWFGFRKGFLFGGAPLQSQTTGGKSSLAELGQSCILGLEWAKLSEKPWGFLVGWEK